MTGELVRIRVRWPRHWLNGHVLVARRSVFAHVEGRPLSHYGPCFVFETRFGRAAIAASHATVLGAP